MSARVKVVVILSLGYTGTTWVNLVLASRPRALALGPPNKVTTLPPERAAEACLVHGADCPFWPDFIHGWDRGANFFRQLARHAGVDLIVLNNPRSEKALAGLADPALDVRYLRVLRDGRANIVSYIRHHHPDSQASVRRVIEDWLLPRWADRDAKMPAGSGPDALLRYEDLATDFDASLARVGGYLGVQYDVGAREYWRYAHHLTEGNSGAVDLLRRFQGLDGLVHHRRGYYAAAYERLKRQPRAVIIDESWRHVLDRADLLAYDYFAGAQHARYGYARNGFTVDEVQAFLAANGLARGPAPDLVESLRLRDKIIAPDSGIDVMATVGVEADTGGGRGAWLRRLWGGRG